MDDSRFSRQDAFERAARRARWFLLGREGFGRSVTATPTLEERYERTLSVIERRVVVVRWAPAPVGAERLAAAPVAAEWDGWAVDGTSLAGKTQVVARCGGCDGAKTEDCSGCSGRRVRTCETCGGRGRVAGQRAGGKQCPNCRAKGQRRCEFCRGKGRVECRGCAGSGRASAWLEVETSVREEVRISPQTAATLAHRRLGDAADFDSEDWPHSLAGDTGTVRLEGDDRTRGLPQLAEGLVPSLDPGRDRLVNMRHQRFAARTHRFGYANAFGEGHVDVSGDPPEILRSTKWGPLWARLGVLVAASLGSLMAQALIFGAYVSRHAWFEQHGSGGWLALVGLLTSVAAVGTLAVATSTRGGLRGRDARLLGAMAVAGVLVGGAVWNVSGPSIEAARTAYERGELADAALTADAHAAIEGKSSAYAELVDDMRLAGVSRAVDVRAAAQLLGERWTSETKRAEAAATFRQRLGGDGDAARERGDAAALDSLAREAREVAVEEAGELRRQAAELRISGCVASKDLSCLGAELDAVATAGVPVGRLADARDGALRESVHWVRGELGAARGAATSQRLSALRRALGVIVAYGALACRGGARCRPSPARELVAAEAVALRDLFVQDRAASALSSLHALVAEPLPEIATTLPWRIAKVAAQRALADEAFDDAFGHLQTAEAKGAPEAECVSMRAELAAGARLATAAHWNAAKSRDLEARDSAYAKALGASRAYALATGESTDPSAATIEQASAKNAEVMAKARAREAEAKRRRDARAEAQRVAREARAARAGAPLLCRDGSHSPSCTCGGSWRGCCSWHGGVRGCSR